MLRNITFPFSELNILFKDDQILLFNGEVIMNATGSDYIKFSVKGLRERLDEVYATEEAA